MNAARTTMQARTTDECAVKYLLPHACAYVLLAAITISAVSKRAYTSLSVFLLSLQTEKVLYRY